MGKTIKYTRNTDEPFDDSDIDYSKIDDISDEEVNQHALNDPDAQPLTKQQLLNFKRVNPLAKKASEVFGAFSEKVAGPRSTSDIKQQLKHAFRNGKI